MTTSGSNFGKFSLVELFRMESEEKCATLNRSLLALEQAPTDPGLLDTLMRAAHSLKGAARIINLKDIMTVAHRLEDVFNKAKQGGLLLNAGHIDILLKVGDALAEMGRTVSEESGDHPSGQACGELVALLDKVLAGETAATVASRNEPPPPPSPPVAVETVPAAAPSAAASAAALPPSERRKGFRTTVQINADELSRLVGFASELRVGSRRMEQFGRRLLAFKRQQYELVRALDIAKNLRENDAGHRGRNTVAAAHHQAINIHHLFGTLLADFDEYSRQTCDTIHRLHSEMIRARMVRFGDGVDGLRRLVRDLGRDLGKRVNLAVAGDDTMVDRDILRQMDSPMTHLVRNALDHGIEKEEVRLAAGKNPEGTITLRAGHRAGLLHLAVEDDGRGIDIERIRSLVIERKMTSAEVAAHLSEEELYEFLFLPGFTTRGQVSEVSGRGVGLDAVALTVRQVGGSIRIKATPGRGVRFLIRLPLSLSVSRSLLFRTGGELYALPITAVHRTLRLTRAEIHDMEGRDYCELDGEKVGLVSARQLLQLENPAESGREINAVVLGRPGSLYGLVVEELVGIRELIVQPLPLQCGKLQDISSGAVIEDGTPVLILDHEDMLKTLDRIAGTSGLQAVAGDEEAEAEREKPPSILVVDDSITVREVEREMLLARGYRVTVAVDGQEAWNMVRRGEYSLLITDVDMPRMDGIELVKRVRDDRRLMQLPIIIVSYKESEQDKMRGLEAGADMYLTKSSFDDERLVQAVQDLIGDAGKRSMGQE
ncbi:MAG: hybrid sensor histidine kinase/response regulator [Thermodesulfobacteriota bacterium]